MVINVKEPDGREAPLHWIEELVWEAYAVTAFRPHELDYLNQAKKALKAPRAPRGARSPMGLDAIIFDMDGVLVDSEPLGLMAMQRLMARHGVTYTAEDSDEFLGSTTLEECRT